MMSSEVDYIDEIRDLLDVIVQVIEIVDTAIVLPGDSKAILDVDRSGYMSNFSSAL